ncbi:MAG: asparaginase domain-containing protein [Rickettsiales bacterium]|nr:asparaginase domain-containing protein [Rickettsiales bacterium]
MKILIITTGGTISQEEDATGIHVSCGDTANQGFLEHVRSYPKNKKVAFDVRNMFNIDSTFMTPRHWNEILGLLAEKHDDYDAFCITHGTNTMGQTAAALSFGLEYFQKPVYITGSQVPFGLEGADANQNFENMIKLARDNHKNMKGVFVVVGSAVACGTRAKKISDNSYAAFSSFQASAVAELGARSEVLFNKKVLNDNNKRFSGDGTARVFDKFPEHIVTSLNDFSGIDGNDLKILADSGKKGFVFRGTGAADVSREILSALPYLREKKIPIVVTTQIPTGLASMDINEPGIEAAKLGAIPAFDMSIESITAKMLYLIAKGVKYENFKREMLTNYKGEINSEKFKKEIARAISL